MKKFVLLSSVLLLPFMVISESEKSDDPQLLAQKIAESNMHIFSNWGGEWDSDDWEECLRRFLDETVNPRPSKKRRIAFEFLKTVEKRGKALGAECDCTMWQDLDLFCGKGDKQKFVAQSLDRTQTELGKLCLYMTLAQPITDVSKLIQRQQIIKLFIDNEELKLQLDHYLSMVKSSENVMLSFWDRDAFKQGSRRHLFNSFLKPLNNYQLALLAKSGFDHTKRVWDTGYTGFVAAGLLTYGVLQSTRGLDRDGSFEKWAQENKSFGGSILAPLWRINNRFVHAGVALLAGAWCVSSLHESIKWSRACFVFEKCIQTLMIHVAQFTRGLEGLYALVQNNTQLEEFGEFVPLIHFFEQSVPQNEKLQEFLVQNYAVNHPHS